jgi:very-short-patch-repair endonuclease
LEKGDGGGFKEMLHYNKGLREHSRQLRKNMTDAERLVWSRLRGKQLKEFQFYRQKPIGNFIIDFYCPRAKLVIELDGGQHFSTDGTEKDRQRDAYLGSLGLTVLRFSDREVFEHLDAVMQKIWSCL